MSASRRSSSATTSRAQARSDFMRIDLLKRKSRGDKFDLQEMSLWAQSTRGNEVAPFMLDARGNACPNTERSPRRIIRKIVMNAWKNFVHCTRKRRAYLQRLFDEWVNFTTEPVYVVSRRIILVPLSHLHRIPESSQSESSS